MNISVDIFYSIALSHPKTHLTEMLGDYKMSNMIYCMTTI